MIYVGSGTSTSVELAAALAVDSELVAPVEPPPDAETGWGWSDATIAVLDAWRARLDALEPAAGAVVCAWPEPVGPTPLAELDEADWRTAVEWPTALWFTTVVAVAGRCRDGASLVVVVERPATLDAEGRGPAVAVADGVVNLVRSLAATHGPRGVRANVVASQLETSGRPLQGSPPPLAAFPGRPGSEVAGAVRFLLSPDAGGVTGTVLDTGCGR